MHATDLLADAHSDGHFAADCDKQLRQLAIAYRLFFDLDAQHRGLLRMQRDGGFDSHVFSPEASRFELAAAPRQAWREFAEFAREGVWHIWIGYDHILFLLSLLLPAALVAVDGRWQARPEFRRAAWDVVKIVSAFTLAHSITLSLATLGYLALRRAGWNPPSPPRSSRRR